MKHSGSCAVCKRKATRRDIAEDGTMDAIVAKFKIVEDQKQQFVDALSVLAAQKHKGEEEDRGRERLRSLLPWVRGVQNDDYTSPSRSLSGTALEELRKKGASRSPSPCSRSREHDDGGDSACGDSEAKQDADSTLGPKQVTPIDRDGDVKRWQGGVPHVVVPDTVKKHPLVDRASQLENMVVPESPVESVGQDAGHKIDDILAGLEDDMEGSGEHETPHAALPSLPLGSVAKSTQEGEHGGVSVSTVKENLKQTLNITPKTVSTGRGKRKNSAKHVEGSKTVKRARSSRKAIEEAKTPTPGSQPSQRRIPARLLPWSCIVCTFDNKGSSLSCEMCGQQKGSDAPSPEAMEAQRHVAVSSLKRAKKSRSVIAEEAHILTSTPCGSVETGTQEHAGCSTGAPKQTRLTGRKGRQQHVAATKQKAESRFASISSRDIKHKESVDSIEKKHDDWSRDDCKVLSRYVITGSGLQPDEKDVLKAFCAQTGGQYSSEWNKKITHIVCGGEVSSPKVTFKYLMGILSNKKILSHSWIEQCMESKSIADETKHAVQLNQSMTKSNAKYLLKGFEVQIQGICLESKGQVTELLQAAGAKVSKRMPTATDGKKGIIVVLDSPNMSTADMAMNIVKESWYARALGASVPILAQAWLKDCIVQGSVCDFKHYMI